ncbi:MAG: hypothetical protein V3V04_03910 [Rhizobiaceae bacterium]
MKEKDIAMGFRKVFDRMIAGREKKARQYALHAMLNFDDEILKNAGYNREDLQKKSTIVYPF